MHKLVHPSSCWGETWTLASGHFDMWTGGSGDPVLFRWQHPTFLRIQLAFNKFYDYQEQAGFRKYWSTEKNICWFWSFPYDLLTIREICDDTRPQSKSLIPSSGSAPSRDETQQSAFFIQDSHCLVFIVPTMRKCCLRLPFLYSTRLTDRLHDTLHATSGIGFMVTAH